MRHSGISILGAGAFCLLLVSLASSTFARTLETDLPAPANFENPLGTPRPIDNMYLPLPVGASFAYTAETEDGCELNKLTVTSELKELNIGGTTYWAQVIRDQEWEAEDCVGNGAELVEDTKDYHTQDYVTQNVWYLGEETYALPDEDDCEAPPCECDAGGSWEAGLPVGDPEVEPAEAGVIMLGSPSQGDRYPQEFLADEAEDWGAVLRLNARVSIDFGDFENCLMTREWTPIEPGEIEHKFYCPSAATGNVYPGGLMYVHRGTERENG
jgi:hypothetical protein